MSRTKTGFFRKNRSLRDECSPQPRQTRVSISSSKAIFHPRLLALVSVSRLGLIRFSTFKTVEDSVHATISRKEERKKKKKHGIQIRNAWNFKCEIHALISRLPYIPYILNPSRSPIFARLSTVPKRIETRREIEANRERTKSFMSPE